MRKELHKLLSEGIYYSFESLQFYKAFYSEKGVDEILELSSSINDYLHRIVRLNSLNLREKVSAACVGRYRDKFEIDEKSFGFDCYYINLVPIEVVFVGNDLSFSNSKPCNRLSKALLFASRAHSQQRRKSDNSPYIEHLIEVMDLLANIAEIDDDIIIAGILHDIIEDTKVTKPELKFNFGSRVSSIVVALTDDKTLPLSSRRNRVLKKLKSAPGSVKVIKLADACSNSSSIPASWEEDRLAEYFVWLDQVALECRDASEPLYQTYLMRRATIKLNF
jgi:hypothetical protein